MNKTLYAKPKKSFDDFRKGNLYTIFKFLEDNKMIIESKNGDTVVNKKDFEIIEDVFN